MLTETSDWIYENRRPCVIGALCGFAACGLLIEFGPANHLFLILGTSSGVFGVIQGGGFLYLYRRSLGEKRFFGIHQRELMGMLGFLFVVVGFILALRGLAELVWIAASHLLGFGRTE